MIKLISNARQGKALKEYCIHLGMPIARHLAKLLLFSDSEREEYWKNEIITFITDASEIDLKGGKFDYSWFFEGLKPYTKKRLQGIINRVLRVEKGLTSIGVDIVDLETLVFFFERILKEEYKKKKDVLNDEEILGILTICLKESRYEILQHKNDR
jgi:hypothetical protein